MRRAELVTAAVLAVFSLYLMWKSAELPIGWIPDEGPGGGAFPFWLSVGMLVCSVVIFYRALKGQTPASVSTEPFMDGPGLKLFLVAAGSLTVMIGLIQVVGVYVAVPLFLVFYVRVFGGHSWLTAGLLALATPVVTFFFFEIGLKILLPKGVTEPLFYPLFQYFL